MADRPPLALTPELLDRYLAGECTPEEVAQIRRYLMARPETARVLRDFLDGLDSGHDRPPAPNAAESWAVVQRRLREGEGEERDTSTNAPSRTIGKRASPSETKPRRESPATILGWRRGRFLMMSAAVLVAVVALAGVRLALKPPPTAARTYSTVPGERSDLRLPDGTHVRVAPATRLVLTSDFGIRNREAYLDGEAYFQVRHDSRRPFLVHAAGTTTRDVGTEFAVRSYPEDSAVQVVVRSGHVELNNLDLAAGDVGRSTAGGRATVEHRADVRALLAWMDGRLVFHNAPLSTVLAELRRWYGVDVQLSTSALGQLPFTGELGELPPSSAVDLVAMTLGLRVRQRDERLVLDAVPGRTPRQMKPMAPPH